jgi:hypothetical protein
MKEVKSLRAMRDGVRSDQTGILHPQQEGQAQRLCLRQFSNSLQVIRGRRCRMMRAETETDCCLLTIPGQGMEDRVCRHHGLTAHKVESLGSSSMVLEDTEDKERRVRILEEIVGPIAGSLACLRLRLATVAVGSPVHL